VLHWECVDPPWELPDYVSDLAQALQDTQAWIASGGIVENVVAVATPTLPQPVAPNNGKSKVEISNEELPSPQQLVSKVRWSEKVEHTLDKGLWAGTGAMQQVWKVFIKVSP